MEGDGVATAYLERVQSDLPNAVSRIELKGNQITMGRGIGNSIIWESLQISRRHAVMEYRNQKWMIKDTSTNGMLINSARIPRNTPIPLNDKDVISFVPTGSLQYRFVKISSPRKYGSPHALSPAVVEDPGAVARVEESVAEVTPGGAFAKSPKRKTGSGPIDHVNPEKKRKCLYPSPSTTMSKQEPLESEEEELLDIDDVPSFFTPCSNKNSSYSENDNKFEHQDVLDLGCLKGIKGEDLSRVKNQFQKYEDRIRKLEDEKKGIVQEHSYQLLKIQNQLKSAQSENRVFQEELFKKIMEGLETEFSCCICNEIFIQATVIDCGHTFCSHCLAEWMKRKPECPTCRKQVRVQVKHIEMENFITKIHTILSEEIQQKRQQIIQERREAEASSKAVADAAAAAMAAAAAAANRQPQRQRLRPDPGLFEPFGMERVSNLLVEFIGQHAHEILPPRGAVPPPPPVVAHGHPEHFHPRHYPHFTHFHPFQDIMRTRQGQTSGPSTRRRSVRVTHREAAPRGPGPVRGRGAQQVPDMPPHPLGDFNIPPGHMDILTVD